MSKYKYALKSLVLIALAMTMLSGCSKSDDDDYKALALAASTQAESEDLSIAVTGVTLPLSDRLLADATSFTLTAEVQPLDATNTQVTWTSSDSTVAEVDENGKVSALSVGETTITAQTVDGAFTATCKVKVVPMLVITTTNIDNSVGQALTDLGCTFDEISSQDWTAGIDFSVYDMAIIAMDGGNIEETDVQMIRANVIDQGKRAFFLGGSAYPPFVNGVNQYLVANDITNYQWVQTAATNFTITDATHALAQSLPATYDFVDASARYYQLRTTDTELEVVAQNGDGFNSLFQKTYATGGDLVWFTHSPESGYWDDVNDFAVLKGIIANSLTLEN